MVMPSPGAVCPASVIWGFRMFSCDCSSMVPDTSNTIIRAPDALIAARKLPSPASFRLVTLITFPPRPPVTFCPKPSAPGKANASSTTGVGPSSSSLPLSFSVTPLPLLQKVNIIQDKIVNGIKSVLYIFCMFIKYLIYICRQGAYSLWAYRVIFIRTNADRQLSHDRQNHFLV